MQRRTKVLSKIKKRQFDCYMSIVCDERYIVRAERIRCRYHWDLFAVMERAPGLIRLVDAAGRSGVLVGLGAGKEAGLHLPSSYFKEFVIMRPSSISFCLPSLHHS